MEILNYLRPFICVCLLVFSAQASEIKFSGLDRNERDQFLALTNWKRSIRMVRVNGDRKRQVVYRSLRDKQKFKSPIGEFQSLLNKFYHNSRFKCDNLAAYEYYVDIANERPFDSVKCDNFFSTFVTVASGYKEIGFYKNRVVKLSYLMASNGESAMSRFGHSMFYLRACTKDIENCPLRDQTEFILGVVADVDDLSPGLFKGIFGGYATKIDFMTLSQVKQKYNYDEFRNLDQYDLNLSQREIDRFISHALKLYVDKDMGSYKFFSANCATESYKILRATVDSRNLRSKPLTPKGLLKDLKEDGIAKEKMTRQFLEKSKKINSHLNQLGFTDINEYYETDISKRYEIAKMKSQEKLLATKVAYVFLEKMALIKLQGELTSGALKAEDSDLQEYFEGLAIRYKDWVRDNSKRARQGLTPIKSDVVTLMNQFYLRHYQDEVNMISVMAKNINKAKRNFQ